MTPGVAKRRTRPLSELAGDADEALGQGGRLLTVQGLVAVRVGLG
eukprot:CAMPEP_0176190396 /NCGR_PEP_ID=MMETSP0121_2-20121125/3918_1 /TAXON_ID=160619 /ORGANISM="Kryptoperidinium foliaceum, Strain CCMP 1326" /LENGTH=44 /DNA_ID= /DNA_START= /DNA_END= /DNA_ORIENTATION=